MKDDHNCHDYSIFNENKPDQTILKVPCRSPFSIIDKIKPYIQDKTVCELGSAVGDFLLEMGKYAKKVIGVEIDQERVLISRKRGLYTICADATSPFSLPEKIDVYYMWMEDNITRKAFDNIENGLIIMAGELGYASEKGYSRGIEVKVLDEIYAEYPQSQMIEVNYNEGDGDRESGIVCLLIVEK